MDDVAILRALLEAYSPSGREGEAVSTFLRLARSLAFTAHADREGNGIARIGARRPQVTVPRHTDNHEAAVARRLGPENITGSGALDAREEPPGALAATRRGSRARSHGS